jgi:AIPR protein
MARIDVDYPGLLKLFPGHLNSKRSESASFLIWYLENYYRLDSLEAVDCVCDKRGDKGVDGIFVNENDKTITVYQSKINQSRDTTIGDASLRAFAGTLTQFKDAESIQNLITSAGNSQLAALAKRHDLINKVSTHELRGEFVSNVDLDKNGASFLKTQNNVTFAGKTILESSYISDERNVKIHKRVAFDIGGFRVTEYTVNAKTKAIIAPIKATELIALQGIADQSIFAYNVRGPLGRTQVNKDIVSSIRDTKSHKLFPLFHNGITIIANGLDIDKKGETISATDYFVVNGCQSLTALFDNREHLTDNLRVLTKFIKMEPASPLAKQVTEFSNNQNGVKPRDFMSNNPMQIRLQNEFKRDYDGHYAFEIKRGEAPSSGKVISNEDAGLFLMAFDLKEPWGTHRKYQVFEDKYADLFGRPEVTADRVVLCQVIVEAIDEALPSVKNQLFARYRLTRYLFLYIIRVILENDPLSREILERPKRFVRAEKDRKHFRGCMSKIVGDLVVDLNAEVEEYGDDFDYRDKLRDSAWVGELSKKVSGDHLKLVKRGRIKSFADEWKNSGF